MPKKKYSGDEGGRGERARAVLCMTCELRCVMCDKGECVRERQMSVRMWQGG